MSIETILIAEAKYAADGLKGAVAALQTELREIERRKGEIEAKLHAADFAHKRSLNFRPRIGSDFQCPRCWVQNETRTALRPDDSNTRDDIFRCHICGADYVIPN